MLWIFQSKYINGVRIVGSVAGNVSFQQQRSDVEAGFSRDHGDPIMTTPPPPWNPHRLSQHYCIEGFKGLLLVPPLCRETPVFWSPDVFVPSLVGVVALSTRLSWKPSSAAAFFFRGRRDFFFFWAAGNIFLKPFQSYFDNNSLLLLSSVFYEVYFRAYQSIVLMSLL